MAINFEAANMAGYNNPQIEVFVITLGSDENIATAPSKSELLNCNRRGSLPFLYLIDSSQTGSWLLPLSNVTKQPSGNYEFSFGAVFSDSTGAHTAVSIFYPASGDTPTLGVQALQK